MNRKFVCFAVFVLLLSGCAWSEGFLHGVGDPSGTASHQAGEEVGRAVGTVLTNVAPALPSPWRELLLGVLGLIAGFFGRAATEEKKENKSWNS